MRSTPYPDRRHVNLAEEDALCSIVRASTMHSSHDETGTTIKMFWKEVSLEMARKHQCGRSAKACKEKFATLRAGRLIPEKNITSS